MSEQMNQRKLESISNQLYQGLRTSTLYLFLDVFLLSFIFSSFPFTSQSKLFHIFSYINIFPNSLLFTFYSFFFWIIFSILFTNSCCCFQLFQPHGFKLEERRLIFYVFPQSHKSNIKFQNSPNIFEMLITLKKYSHQSKLYDECGIFPMNI